VGRAGAVHGLARAGVGLGRRVGGGAQEPRHSSEALSVSVAEVLRRKDGRERRRRKQECVDVGVWGNGKGGKVRGQDEKYEKTRR
jgi:hypothetical protein